MPDKQELLSKVIPRGSNLCFKIWTLGSSYSQNNHVRETQIRKVHDPFGCPESWNQLRLKKYLWWWKVVMMMLLHRMLWWNEWRKLIWWEDDEIATGSSDHNVTCFWIFINALQLHILLLYLIPFCLFNWILWK